MKGKTYRVKARHRFISTPYLRLRDICLDAIAVFLWAGNCRTRVSLASLAFQEKLVLTVCSLPARLLFCYSFHLLWLHNFGLIELFPFLDVVLERAGTAFNLVTAIRVFNHRSGADDSEGVPTCGADCSRLEKLFPFPWLKEGLQRSITGGNRLSATFACSIQWCGVARITLYGGIVGQHAETTPFAPHTEKGLVNEASFRAIESSVVCRARLQTLNDSTYRLHYIKTYVVDTQSVIDFSV